MSLKESDCTTGPYWEGVEPFNVGRGNVGPPKFPLQVWWEWQLNGAVGEEGSKQAAQGKLDLRSLARRRHRHHL